MLALPILTGLAGFFPSLFMFVCAWAFMTLTALMLVEVNGWFSYRVNIASMVAQTLGRTGKAIGSVLYLFLFFAILVAYVSGIGGISSTILSSAFAIQAPDWAGSLFFVLLFGWIVYAGTRRVDLWNRGLMLGKILSYAGIVFLGMRHVDPQLLLHTDLPFAVVSLPLLVISFGFHNMIPSLTAYMGGDVRRVRKAILIGGLFTLSIYVVWDIVVLGIVPVEGANGILESLKNDQEASQALTHILGSSWVSGSAQSLAFFALLTSFLAQSLGLVHFLADGLKISYKKRENPLLCAFVLALPLILSLMYPQLFFKALNFAGGFCAVILFGLMPVCMVWRGRYRQHVVAPYRVAGGKALLGAVFLFALFILFFEISSMMGASYLPGA
jgi:tyrosine-specific transport protein